MKGKFFVYFLVFALLIETAGFCTRSGAETTGSQISAGAESEEITAVIPEGATTFNAAEYHKGYLKYTSVQLPDSLEEIPAYAFYNWAFLREVTIPANVKKIGKKAFQKCGNLRIVNNLSSQTVILPTKQNLNYSTKLGLEWYIDGEKVTKVPPGKKAVAKCKKFSLKLNLEGGKLQGKNVKSYMFGKNTKLPKAKKKGYIFFGWALHLGDDFTIFSLKNERGLYTGNLKLTAIWKKYTVKKNKKQIVIKVYDLHDHDKKHNLIYFPLACQYSRKKNMENAKLVDLGLQYSPEYRKGYRIKYNKKKDVLTCRINNCKKGTYYMQFRILYIPIDGEDENPYYLSDFCKKKIIKI